MVLGHSSYSYPSHWVPLFEAVAVVVLLVVLWVWRARGVLPGEGWVSNRLRAMAGWKRRPPSPLLPLALAVAVVLALLLIWSVLGDPVPWVADEVSYLFQGEVFAAGRLHGGSHPAGAASVYFQVLHEPVRASKYPPGQAVLLALGTLLGRPALGVALGGGMMVAALAWMVARWFHWSWALCAGLWVLIRLGISGYWNQSYWGGCLAATGGALALASLGTWSTRAGAQFTRGFVLALGGTILVFSRPFEGALLMTCCCSWFVVQAVRERAGLRLLGLATCSVLGVGLLAVYNSAITGSPWLLPHALYTATEIEGHHHFSWEETRSAGAAAELFVRRFFGRGANMLFLVLGGIGVVPLVGYFVRGRSPRSAGLRDPRLPLRWVVGCVVVALLGLAVTERFFAHYGAPMVAPLMLVWVAGASSLLGELPAGRSVTIVFWALALQCCLALLQLPAQRPDADDWASQRQAISEQLRASPGRDLVLVEEGRSNFTSWSFPVVDPTTAPVVWVDLAKLLEVRHFDPSANAPPAWLTSPEWFGRARVWRLRVDAPAPRPELWGQTEP